MKRTFKREELIDMGLPYDAPEGGKVLLRESCGEHRWTIDKRLVVHFPDQPEGLAWEFYYDVGATEAQECKPWECQDEVEATLVRQVEVVVKEWQEVEE